MKSDKIPIPGSIHNLALVIVELALVIVELNTLAMASTDDEQRDKLNLILEMVEAALARALARIATLATDDEQWIFEMVEAALARALARIATLED